MENKTFLRLGKRLISLDQGLVMGIVNVTPDSFYGRSRVATLADLKARIEKMLEDGADIVDVGAVSTRPGAALISENEEWNRLAGALDLLSKYFPGIPVSVDTFRSEIARRSVVDYGACLINDISAGLMDKALPEMIARLQVPVVLMHMQNLPENMQNNPVYDQVTLEVIQFFSERIEQFKQHGVNDIILDPGFGFGKTLIHNYQLLQDLNKFVALGYPVLVGLSRKSMIYDSLGTNQNEALNGTTALHAMARSKGAQIFRVHDVREAVECLKLVNQVMNPEEVLT